MDWQSVRPKLIYVLLVIIILIIGYLLYQYNECKKKGRSSGGSYKCSFFSSTPETILPIDEYYDIRFGECYHYIDFGDRMSIKKVEMDKCN